MGKTGNVAQLSSLLAEKTAQDRQQIEEQTSEQLRLHAESLKRLSSDALSTTRSAIEQQQQALAASLSALQKQIEAQRQALAKATKGQHQALTDEIEAQTKRLLWLMKWPILGTLAVCLVICGLTWGYWTLAKPYGLEVMGDGRTYQVMKGDGWTLCTLGQPPFAINRPCRLD